jgi:hypothetical protein
MAAPKSSKAVGAERKKVSAATAKKYSLERERQMAVIEALSQSTPGAFAKKAQILLTLRWSKADWPARGSILRTVNWLLRLEQHRSTAPLD